MEAERAVWEQYEELLDRSRTQFALLRELPWYGRKQWDVEYQSAFQTYAHLWRFQRDQRQALTSQGLRRWEIGDLASRIGQLYYNYYLRTSGLNFLTEAYEFLDAIHAREYYPRNRSDIADGQDFVVVKQLRFYLRLIIVCLLMGKAEEAWNHLDTLGSLIDTHTSELEAADMMDWRAVSEEVGKFFGAVFLGHKSDAEPRHPLMAPLRMHPHARVAGIPFTAPFLRLHEAVLACYYRNQVKIGELPLDTFRILQTLEWEDPAARGLDSPDSNYNADWPEGSTHHESPAKYLLYRPTASQFLAVLATACESLPPVSTLLVYISAAGVDDRTSTRSSSQVNVVQGVDAEVALAGACGADEEAGSSSLCLCPPSSSGPGESYLFPDDILPHTRRPLFLIIDSPHGRAFRSLQGRERSYAAVALISPVEQPPGVQPPQQVGNLFTLFLASPELALCVLMGNPAPEPEVAKRLQAALLIKACCRQAALKCFYHWMSEASADQDCCVSSFKIGLQLKAYIHAESKHDEQMAVDAVLLEWGETLADAAGSEWFDTWVALFGDPLLRRLVLRFLLCRAALALHHAFSNQSELQPTCFPPFPESVSTKTDLVVEGMAQIMSVLGDADDFFGPGPHVRSESFSETDFLNSNTRQSGSSPG